MKKNLLKYLLLILLPFVILTACDKDDNDDDVSPDLTSKYIGNYTITEAKLASALVISTNEIGDIPVPVGQDITEMIQAALLGEVECTPEKSFIEIRDDNTLFLSCDGASELDAGTWTEVDETTLKLNMNAAAIPASPVGIVLTVNNIVIEGSKLSGATSVLLPRDMIAGMVAQLSGGLATLDVENTPVAIPVDITLVLAKQ